ncbi:MAG: hypothetical protein IJ445_07300 [Clostridia bacterium]|nr:hypothetical protein [Clostridia bacterium]
MKKLTAILLAILMLIPLIASCGGSDETTTTEIPTTEHPTTEAPTTEAPTTEAPTMESPTIEVPTTEAPSTVDPNVLWSSKTDIRDTWSGKTLNVACSTWYSTGAPWAMPETFITEDNDANFGKEIQETVLDRNKFIESTYGVKVNWINATKASMHNVLEAATIAKNINYDLAVPRMMNAHSIVAGGYIYDLANREFIDLRNTYYDKNAVNTYTAYGHTFFITGGFSTINKECAYVLYFNKNILGDGSENVANELYELVRDGKWTYDKFVTYASSAYVDDGDGIINKKDSFGFYLDSYDRFFRLFGTNIAGVNEATGEWELTIKSNNVNDIIAIIIKVHASDWFRNTGLSSYGNIRNDLADGGFLFYCDTLRISDKAQEGNVGVIPFPMLNEEQGRYYVPTDNQIPVLLCIPKLTQDREMSEYFMDVLSWTGNKYIVDDYLEIKHNHFKSDVDIEMLKSYIFPNISYDVGEHVGLGTLMYVHNSYTEWKNHFYSFYEDESPAALETIAEWNAAWGGYTEE